MPSTSFMCDFSLQLHHRHCARYILILLKNNALQAKGYIASNTQHAAVVAAAPADHHHDFDVDDDGGGNNTTRQRMTVASNNERFNLHKRGRWIDGFSPNIVGFEGTFWCVDNGIKPNHAHTHKYHSQNTKQASERERNR